MLKQQFLKYNKLCKGFNLIELQIVILVMAIGFATFFSMREIIDRLQIESISNRLYGDISLARSEAVKRNNLVSICASSNGTSCNTTNWSTGWLVFLNPDADGVSTDDIIFYIQQDIIGEFSITPNNDDRVDFFGNGRSSFAREITVCRNGTNNQLTDVISITESGQITKNTVLGNCP